MNIERIIKNFESYDTNILNEYKGLISTRKKEKIYPPYIPHVGINYEEYNILMYGMAQSIDKPWEELENKSKLEKVRQLYDAKNYSDVWIAPYKVMLAVAGIYIYAKYNDPISSFEALHNSIAASNYYKFSLSDNGKDVNPNTDLIKYQSPELYWKKNDGLSIYELNELKPSIVLSFNGRHNNVIENQGIQLIKINDPSWILQGGSGVLKKTGSWFRNINDKIAIELVNSYLEQIDKKYEGKRDAIRIYLMKYYSDWAGNNT